jgi:hypothetical protein
LGLGVVFGNMQRDAIDARGALFLAKPEHDHIPPDLLKCRYNHSKKERK